RRGDTVNPGEPRLRIAGALFHTGLFPYTSSRAYSGAREPWDRVPEAFRVRESLPPSCRLLRSNRPAVERCGTISGLWPQSHKPFSRRAARRSRADLACSVPDRGSTAPGGRVRRYSADPAHARPATALQPRRNALEPDRSGRENTGPAGRPAAWLYT